MGQTNSSRSSSPHVRHFTEIPILTYEDFQLYLEHLNNLSKDVAHHTGKQLLFGVKEGADSTVLWKETVKITCIKIDTKTKVIECHKLFNLNQFMRIFKTLECQLIAAFQSSQKEMMDSLKNLSETNFGENFISSKLSDSSDSSLGSEDSSYHESVSDNSSASDSENESKTIFEKKKTESSSYINFKSRDIQLKSKTIKKLTASMLLDKVDNLANSIKASSDKLGECCICWERKHDVVLPCAHAYCMPCIEQWNTCHKTCPLCRERLDNTGDTWIISDIPSSQEIGDEICSTLTNLTSP